MGFGFVSLGVLCDSVAFVIWERPKRIYHTSLASKQMFDTIEKNYCNKQKGQDVKLWKDVS